MKQELETRIECLEDDFQSKCQEKDNYIETLKEINQGLVLKLKRDHICFMIRLKMNHISLSTF